MNRMFPKLALVLAIVSTPALAQTRWYAGASLGESRTDNALIANRESTVVNAAVTSSDFDAKDSGFKVFGGYRLAPWVAVEVNYSDLGQSRLKTNILTADPPTPGSVVLNRNISGYGADLLLSAPLGPRALVYGRVGVVRAKTEAEAILNGAIVFTSGNPADRSRRTSVNESLTRYGVGGEWGLSQNMALRLDWERWLKVGKAFEIGGTGTTGEADTDFYSVGIVYRF